MDTDNRAMIFQTDADCVFLFTTSLSRPHEIRFLRKIVADPPLQEALRNSLEKLHWYHNRHFQAFRRAIGKDEPMVFTVKLF